MKKLLLLPLVGLLALLAVWQALAATLVVTPSNMQGWTTQSGNCTNVVSTGSQSFVNGPATPPLGSGSLKFTIGADGDSFETVRQPSFNLIRLDEINALSYSTFSESGGTGDQAAYLLLNIDFDGNAVLDDQLFFEPEYQNGYTTNVPTQAALVYGSWQTWDAGNGGWWSNSTAGVGPGADVKTLAYYLTIHPNARIINTTAGAGGFRIATGCGAGAWDSYVGYADALTLLVNANSRTYDFELAQVASSKDACKNGGWQNLTRADGSPFKNQGDCIQYVNTGK